jgi:hypothetical protein
VVVGKVMQNILKIIEREREDRDKDREGKTCIFSSFHVRYVER